MGVGFGGASMRARPVMGVGAPGEKASPYKTSFEKALLAQSEEFYRAESESLLIECDAPSFLKRVRISFFFPSFKT
jgi:cullin 3